MSEQRLTILILGGYGTFGGRLAQLLAPIASLTLIIAGRSLDKAEQFIAKLPAAATLRAAAIDRNGTLDEALARLKPDVVVDATGPFQAYGDDPYRIVRASLGAGAHYLDLADGSDFVEGIEQFDGEAKAKGRFVLAGVSSFPVLTAAAVRALGSDLERIDQVTGGIAPSPYAGVGLNVVRAVCSYAGKPIRLVRDGRESQAYGLTETLRYTIAPPGRLPLRNTRFSLVDVPDLLLVPRAIPGIASMWMGAGPVPEILHRALNGFAWLVRLKLLPSMAPLAGLCYRAINIVRWGEHRGGMFVEIRGTNAAGDTIRRSWHLLAEGSDGPLIPSMAVEAIILKVLDGLAPAPGARPATAALELEDYDRVFTGRTIFTGRRDDSVTQQLPLYPHVLGEAWPKLPQVVRDMHPGRPMTATGRARIEAGQNLLARLVRWLMGFPEAADDVAVTVRFEMRDGIETWTRRFGDEASFSSTQQAGTGRNERLLVERFGPLRFAMAVLVESDRLSLVVRRWSVLGVPLPLALAPAGEAFEREVDGRFRFDVTLRHRLVGLIVRYSGWLSPDMKPAPASADLA